MAEKVINASVNGVASVANTQCTNDQQWTKYHTKQGGGFAAEDANALWDRIGDWTSDNTVCIDSLLCDEKQRHTMERQCADIHDLAVYSD